MILVTSHRTTPLRDSGEHRRQQENDQNAEEGNRAPNGQRLDIAYKTRIGCQAGQFGQIEEHERQHDDAVEDALHDDGGQRRRNRNLLPPFQHHRPEDFPRSCRIDIVAHVANRDDRKHSLRRDGFYRTKQIVPAPGPRPHSDKINPHTGDQPKILPSLQNIPNITNV